MEGVRWKSVGMTGTRAGITDKARSTLLALMKEVGATELHHGDCQGADASAHDVALELGLNVVIHPPIEGIFRANCAGPSDRITTHPPLAYIVRNQQIVNYSDGVFVLPAGFKEERRSGTWSTYRYARGIGVTGRAVPIPTVIIYPDGSTKHETERGRSD